MIVKPIKLDSWVQKIIVDPLSKEPLSMDEENNFLVSSYGRKYPVKGELFDLRLLNNETTTDQRVWKEGQREYERFSTSLASHDQEQDYFAEIEGVREVYEDISVEGCCLDVGGFQGRLRQFLSPDQDYITCDPFMNGFDNLDKQPNLLKAYPFLLDPVNFVCCDAEFLPFKSAFFQTVHMRSVIDHFLSPELALNEAYRVLRPDGALIVGLLVHGGKQGKPDIKFSVKKIIKDTLVAGGIKRFKDYHVWHPTYKELINLISNCGFSIEKVHWQKGYDDTVCYVYAGKRLGLTKRST
ncbi:MAG: methyltransferase domain-containing protein [Candidatus Wallbacteria bacterium]|nr:methyltransferase domain-containing protein [Candidatus Wallbacteria bacterium]